jgi:type IV pilus assembly protein PilQ
MIKIWAKNTISIVLTLALMNLHGVTAHVWAADAATLDGIEVAPDQITMHLSDQVRFNSFITSEPPRLVVELLNTEYSADGKGQKGQGKFLKKVRSAQYQREPNLISRVVLDLKKLVAYRANWDKNRLVVMLVGGAQDGEKEEAEGTDAAYDENDDSDWVTVDPAPAAKPAPVAAKKPAVAASSALRDAPMAPAVQAEPKPVKATTLPKKMTTSASSELRQIAMGSDIRPVGGERKKKRRRRKKAARAAAELEIRAVRRDILATLPADPITLDFDETNIQDILKLLAMKAKVNVVYGSDVAGALTLHLNDVPFNEAFMTVLSMQGLVAAQVGQNILRVMTPKTLEKERAAAVTQTRVIKLNYVKADEVKAALDSVRTAEGRAGVINIDKYTNSLIITDSLDGIAAAERLLSDLDVRPKQVMIEVKLVEVSLSKDFNIGVEWDYFSVDTGKALGKEGSTVIGAIPSLPSTIVNPRTGQGLDDNALTFNGGGGAGGSVGAGGRGTGVFLPATNVFGAFTYGRVVNDYMLNATLTAAASRGKAKVLSDPKISALNGEKASIDITTNVPFVTSETVQGATPTTTEKVSYTVTGIKLAVEPTINSDGSITMKVAPEVSQPSTVSASAGSTGAIATDSRKASTIVHVQDGETFVIGGLISDSESENIAKVPLLGDIPIIGWLFKKKSTVRNRTELLIFVTSKIVNN